MSDITEEDKEKLLSLPDSTFTCGVKNKTIPFLTLRFKHNHKEASSIVLDIEEELKSANLHNLKGVGAEYDDSYIHIGIPLTPQNSVCNILLAFGSSLDEVDFSNEYNLC